MSDSGNVLSELQPKLTASSKCCCSMCKVLSNAQLLSTLAGSFTISSSDCIVLRRTVAQKGSAPTHTIESAA